MNTFSRFPVPELDGLSEDIRARIVAVHEKAGFIPNVFLAWAHRPDEFRAFFAYHDALLEKEGGLTKAEREMIVVATSAVNHCHYCVIAHGAILRIRARQPLLADQVAINYLNADLTERQRAMLDFGVKVAERVNDEDFATLRRHGRTEIHSMLTQFPTVYASTDEGLSLPVVDVTHPAFAVTASDAELAAAADQFVRESESRQEIPAPLREALQRSMLGQGLMAASGSFLTGMHTYLLKLGPDNLGRDANPIDRRIAASFPAFTTRLRLQDMARLLADGLARPLAAHVQRPLCLINIAGGPAADSWNALIHLRAEHARTLAGRSISIAVLDLDDRGPRFGGRAVAALRSSGGPLSDLAIGFRHIPYEWSQADRLGSLLDDLPAHDAACAISSEGGLFEYGSDAEISANLEQLHAGTPPDAIVVGSVTRDGAPIRASQAANRVSIHPRTLDAFRSVARHAGWIVEHVLERPFSYNVRLVKATVQ